MFVWHSQPQKVAVKFCVKFFVRGHYNTHCTHSIAHHSTHSPYTQSVPTLLENVTDSCGSGQLPYPGTVCVRPWYCKERLKMATVTLLTTYSKAPDRPWTGTGAGGWISTAPRQSLGAERCKLLSRWTGAGR